MYQLHYYPGNASFAPHVLLREIGTPFELSLVDRSRNAQKDPAYLKLNPAGRIPVLVNGDLVLFESAAICLHLCDSHPQAGLAPTAGSDERAHFYKWLMFMTNTIQPDILMFYYSDRYTDDAAGGAALRSAADRRLVQWFAMIEEGIDPAAPWFLGREYSAADAFLLMTARWGRGLSTPPRKMAKLRRLLERILERDAVQKAIAAEGIEGPFLGG